MGGSLLILLDTHVVLWLVSDTDKLSKHARAAIDEARQSGAGLAVSGITLVELATACGKGRISLAITLESFLREVEERFVVLPISGRACARTVTLPPAYPKDPADRVIGATALVEGLKLVTSDQAIRRTRAVPTIW